MIRIGIDTGVNTGFAMTINSELKEVSTIKIHKALEYVKNMKSHADSIGKKLIVYIEDARKRSHDPKDKRAMFKMQGVGSVKRDAKIWEDFLKDEKIDFVLVDPKRNKTKLNADKFKLYTKWEARTSEHSRDACMLIFGM